MLEVFGTRARLALLPAVVVSLGVPAAALAHHSFAMFDSTKDVVLNGTVREYQWTNPHSWIQLTVPENGQAIEYSIEMGSTTNYARHGWSRKSLKPGDRIKATIHPRKDGSRGGQILKVVKADGSVLSV